jgi:cobalamin biosynthesis Mg chelatase CobN
MTSLFALLLLASGPARASADSSGIQYQDAPPSACGAVTCGGENHSPPPGSGSQKSGSQKSDSQNNASDDAPTTVEGDLGADESDKQGARPGGEQHTGKKATEGDSPKAKKKNVAGQPAASEDGDGGGGSPLVPILIVMAAAAAISVGVVIYRRKHAVGGPGSLP